MLGRINCESWCVWDPFFKDSDRTDSSVCGVFLEMTLMIIL